MSDREIRLDYGRRERLFFWSAFAFLTLCALGFSAGAMQFGEGGWMAWLGAAACLTSAVLVAIVARALERDPGQLRVNGEGWHVRTLKGWRHVPWKDIGGLSLSRGEAEPIYMVLNPPGTLDIPSTDGIPVGLQLKKDDLADFLRRLDELTPKGLPRNWKWPQQGEPSNVA